MRFDFIFYDEFDWDQGNLSHCQRHGVKSVDVEKFFNGRVLFFLDKRSKGGEAEERWIATGEIEKDRWGFICFTFREIQQKKCIRPISARYIHRNSKEEKIYEKIRQTFFEKK